MIPEGEGWREGGRRRETEGEEGRGGERERNIDVREKCHWLPLVCAPQPFGAGDDAPTK